MAGLTYLSSMCLLRANTMKSSAYLMTSRFVAILVFVPSLSRITILLSLREISRARLWRALPLIATPPAPYQISFYVNITLPVPLLSAL
jgi:hypothetical protein